MALLPEEYHRRRRTPGGTCVAYANPHAEALSRYILKYKDKLPITIGIQGEWGQGKTTLVNLLCYHLSHPEGAEKPIKFVSFSAWPYTTSEKLWRALILKIARALYGKDKSGSPGQTAAAKPGPGAAGQGGQQQQQPQQPAQGDGQPPQPPPALQVGADGNREGKKGGVIHALSRFLSGGAFVLSAPPRDE